MVYLADGSEVEYDGKVGNLHVVRYCYDYGDGEVHVDDPIVVREVFEEPPTKRFHKEVAELQRQVEEQRKILAEHRKALHAVSSEIKERQATLDRLMKMQGLEALEAAINGKITHFAVLEEWRPPEVIAASDAKCDYDHRSMKMLAVSADKTWGLNRYKDGSGCWVTVVPCTSEQEAIQAVRDSIAKRFAGDISRISRLGDFINAARKYGADVPEHVLNHFAATREEAAKQRLKKADEEARKARMALDSLFSQPTT